MSRRTALRDLLYGTMPDGGSFVRIITFWLAFTLAAAAQNTVLADGHPPLTEEMVQHRIWVLDRFLDVHLTPDQQQKLTELQQARQAAHHPPAAGQAPAAGAQN